MQLVPSIGANKILSIRFSASLMYVREITIVIWSPDEAVCVQIVRD